MTDLLEKRMKILDKALLMVPDDKLAFKPADDTMTAAELGIHVYESALVVAGAVEKGDFTRDDLQMIPFDKSSVQTAQDIVDYGNKVKEHVKKVMEGLTEETMSREISFSIWGDFTAKAGPAMLTTSEEVIHHRGQLCTYLRIMGIKPPFIYDYS